MYASWFQYPITRPYPFRWFTLVTIVGGVILAVIFSLINLASSGFYLNTIFTDDPNGTLSAPTPWFMKPPFNWESNLDVKCQPRLLSVGDRFFASSLGFQYEVKAITLLNADDAGTKRSLPSVAYLDNTLDDCFLSKLKFNLEKEDKSTSTSSWLSWTSSMTTTASCILVTDSGAMSLSLGVEYVADTAHEYMYVLEDNRTTHASVWWGTRLLNAYFTGVLQVMSQTRLENDDDSGYWVRAALDYTRTEVNSMDIRSPSFFNLSGWFLASTGDRPDNGVPELPYLDEHPKNFASPVVSEALHHARLLHSLVALDLGSCKSPNLLLNEEGLKYAISAPDDPNRQSGGLLYSYPWNSGIANRFASIPYAGTRGDDHLVPLNESYTALRSLTGKIGCKNATIVSQYICSVPQRKSTGTMLLAILIADLVFLQAAWKILNWVAEGMLPKDNAQVRMCEGCVAAHYQQVQMEKLSEDGKRASTFEEARPDDGSTAQLIDRSGQSEQENHH
ncbi:hypothetical protein B0T10DRAFT_442949 [Thelonectria olida]|uniref:Uncharacterized protein n=1 Tax=Thelonectria olida TaxID=1576542 RepID=A0A9P9AQU6_9HYPO|nr:hypothetical protein B0T10DRAFT_442949 [Thelonectria olida]